MVNKSLVFAVCLVVFLASGVLAGQSYTWTKALAPPTGVGASSLACADGKLYLIGGMAYASPPSYEPFIDKIQCYNPATDSWLAQTAKTPYGLANHSDAATVGTKIIMSPNIGPTSNNGWGLHRKVIEFDTAAQTCVETADYGYVNWCGSLVNGGDGYVYSFGGWTGGGVDKIFRYNPATSVLTELAAKLGAGRDYITSLKYGNSIYLFGGNVSGTLVETFDIATQAMVYSSSILPADLGTGVNIGVSAWDSGDPNKLYVASKTNGHVYDFNTQTKAFTRAAFDLPGFDWGDNRNVVQDPVTGNVYVVASNPATNYSRENQVWVGTAVPEPASFVLGVLGLVAIMRRRW